MRIRNRFLGIALVVSALLAEGWNSQPARAQPETLTIVAANSLRDAFRKILPLYEAQYPETNLRIIYGPSQTLRTQIEQGARSMSSCRHWRKRSTNCNRRDDR